MNPFKVFFETVKSHNGKVIGLADCGVEKYVVVRHQFDYMPKAAVGRDDGGDFMIDLLVGVQGYYLDPFAADPKKKSRIFFTEKQWLAVFVYAEDFVKELVKHEWGSRWQWRDDCDSDAWVMKRREFLVENQIDSVMVSLPEDVTAVECRRLLSQSKDKKWIYRSGLWCPHETNGDGELVPYQACVKCGEECMPRRVYENYDKMCWTCRDSMRPVCSRCGRRGSEGYKTCYNCYLEGQREAEVNGLRRRIEVLQDELAEAKRVRTPDGDLQAESNVAELDRLLAEMDSLTKEGGRADCEEAESASKAQI